MLNYRIWIRCLIHLNVFMFTFKQGLESPKAICSEVESLFQIHVVHITLVNLNSNPKVTQKHILHLCKFNESMHII